MREDAETRANHEFRPVPTRTGLATDLLPAGALAHLSRGRLDWSNSCWLPRGTASAICQRPSPLLASRERFASLHLWADCVIGNKHMVSSSVAQKDVAWSFLPRRIRRNRCRIPAPG